ncbi:hypothetical protein OH687_20095 [Burkholderia anthina]|nr:hypothetical protein OH687_20095 [Burkholderia anthina]
MFRRDFMKPAAALRYACRTLVSHVEGAARRANCNVGT